MKNPNSDPLYNGSKDNTLPIGYLLSLKEK